MLEPTELQRVKVRGRDEVFVVSQIYPSLQLVDLVPVGNQSIVERAVVFEALEVLDDEAEAA